MKRLVSILLLLSLVSIANAQTALGTANSFNVFVFDSATVSGGEAEGAVAVGGLTSDGQNNGSFNVSNGFNTSIQNYSNGAEFGTIAGLTNVSVYAGYNMNVGSENVDNSGNVYVGHSLSGTPSMNGGSIYTGANYVSQSVFTNQQALSLQQSAQLAALPGTAINTADQNQLYIDASTQAGSQKVFTIDASQLSANRQLIVQNLKDSDTLIINVTGTTVSGFGLSLINQNDNGYYSNVLWNFASATSINIQGRELEGSVLAPSAAVTQNNVIEGNLIAQSWTDNGYEDHFGTTNGEHNQFTGSLGLSSTSAVPEPSTVTMLLSGLIALGGITLRRRARR